MLGSGGYVYAKLTEQEEIKANLGVPHLFLGNVGRLSEDRISRYYCNKCRKEHSGSPVINYENPSEEKLFTAILAFFNISNVWFIIVIYVHSISIGISAFFHEKLFGSSHLPPLKITFVTYQDSSSGIA